MRALTLRDYNTRVVVVGTSLLGAAAGIIGTFAYLRKRAMLGDALSHATLPGIAVAFLLVGHKQLGALLIGASVTGVIGILCVLGLRRIPRIKEDAAIGIVLSVFFGVGMVLMSVIQQINTGEEAGLNSFIYGKAAAMLAQDAMLIAVCAGLVIVGAVLLFKEFRVVCFDSSFAAVQGWPVFMIDLFMMTLVVMTTVVGLQAVGLILIVALLIIPAAAARFWTDSLVKMTVLAGVFGTVCGWLGSVMSALTPRLPTGAIIVICTGVIFIFSMVFAPHRGVLATVVRRWVVTRRIAYQNLLRAMAECLESLPDRDGVAIAEIVGRRSWSRHAVARLMAQARRRGVLSTLTPGVVSLTANGKVDARRILRNHRLWELYLIRYADIAPSHVDRDADEIEHVLSASVVDELELALDRSMQTPPSPHASEGVLA